MLQQEAIRQARALLEQPNPVLDGKTPRQAIKTPAGREAVTQMLERQQRLFAQDGWYWIDLSEIWETLGLAKR